MPKKSIGSPALTISSPLNFNDSQVGLLFKRQKLEKCLDLLEVSWRHAFKDVRGGLFAKNVKDALRLAWIYVWEEFHFEFKSNFNDLE